MLLTAGLLSLRAQVPNDPGKPQPPAESPVESKVPGPAAPAGLALAEVAKLPQVVRLRPRSGLAVPTPPFSLKGLVENRRMSPDTASRWQAILAAGIAPKEREDWLKRLKDPRQPDLPAQRYAIFHGTGLPALRRVLGAYYDQVDRMSDEELFALAPWVVLGLRNAVPGTLIDITAPAAWYEIGFLIDVPLECFWRASADAAMPATESHPYDPKKFRRRFLFRNYTRDQARAFHRRVMAFMDEHEREDYDAIAAELAPRFEQDYAIATPRAYGPESRGGIQAPAELFQDGPGRKQLGSNEIGFFSRVESPDRAIRIRAVAIISGARNPMDGKQSRDSAHYERLARALARSLGLPFLDLRARRP
jgi:hypothetical protein